MTFSSYLSSVMGVGICAFLCENIASISERKEKSLEKGLNFITSLCLFCVITLPILNAISAQGFTNFWQNNKESEQDVQSDNEAFYALIQEELEERVKEEIIKEIGIEVQKVSIQLSKVDGELKINKAVITISDKYTDKSEEISALANKLFESETTVTVVESENNE